jgi:hypothetical protein
MYQDISGSHKKPSIAARDRKLFNQTTVKKIKEYVPMADYNQKNNPKNCSCPEGQPHKGHMTSTNIGSILSTIGK